MMYNHICDPFSKNQSKSILCILRLPNSSNNNTVVKHGGHFDKMALEDFVCHFAYFP